MDDELKAELREIAQIIDGSIIRSTIAIDNLQRNIITAKHLKNKLEQLYSVRKEVEVSD